MDPIPGDAVVLAPADRPADGEGESPLEGRDQQLQDSLPLLVIRQEGCPGEPPGVEGFARVWVSLVLHSVVEDVLDDDHPAVRVAGEGGGVLGVHHLAGGGHVPRPHSVYPLAVRALDMMGASLVLHQLPQTGGVEGVTAESEGDDGVLLAEAVTADRADLGLVVT